MRQDDGEIFWLKDKLVLSFKLVLMMITKITHTHGKNKISTVVSRYEEILEEVTSVLASAIKNKSIYICRARSRLISTVEK